jgi:hypothetical protein
LIGPQGRLLRPWLEEAASRQRIRNRLRRQRTHRGGQKGLDRTKPGFRGSTCASIVKTSGLAKRLMAVGVCTGAREHVALKANSQAIKESHKAHLKTKPRIKPGKRTRQEPVLPHFHLEDLAKEGGNKR